MRFESIPAIRFSRSRNCSSTSAVVLRSVVVLLIWAVGFLCGCGKALAPQVGAIGGKIEDLEPPSGKPRTLLEADLGVIPVGATRTHVFEIRNGTSEVWRLHEIRTGCSCTVASADREVVRPGNSVKLTLLFHASDDATDFRKANTISFKTELGTAISYSLVLRGKIRAPLSLSSQLVDFATLEHRAVDPKSIVALNYSDHDFRGLKCDLLASWLRVDITAREASSQGERARQAWTIQLQPSTVPGIGYHRTDVRLVELEPPSGTPPQVKTVKVALSVQPRIAAIPQSLFFGLPRGSTSVRKEVQLKLPREPTPGHDVSVSVAGPIRSMLSVELISHDHLIRLYRVTCGTVEGSRPAAVQSGTIRLALSDGDHEAVTLPVFALCH